MTPLLAALSIAEIAARICSAVRSGAKRICFCSLRRCVLTLRLCAARLSVCRERLSADVVLAIGGQNLLSEPCYRAGYKRLFAASFALCRAPASAPAVRICSKLSELEGGVASIAALICGGDSGVTFAAFVVITCGGACGVTFAVVAAICGGDCGVIFATFVAVISRWLRRYLCDVSRICGGGCSVVFAAMTPPLISWRGFVFSIFGNRSGIICTTAPTGN